MIFFSKPGEYKPCGMYSIGHIVLLVITFICIAIAIHFTKKFNKDNVKKTIKISTIILWVLEVIKIIFNIAIGNIKNPNNYIPLYYCSLILYAGIFSGYCKGKLKKVGDVFISTGAIIGGVFCLFCPNTSLPAYPMLHYISIQSFIFHGTMLYLGILTNITGYTNLKIGDIKYYAILLLLISTISAIVNKIFGTNFMFISNDFPNTPISVIYKYTGKLFMPFMILIQTVGPFYVIYALRKLIHINKYVCEGE